MIIIILLLLLLLLLLLKIKIIVNIFERSFCEEQKPFERNNKILRKNDSDRRHVEARRDHHNKNARKMFVRFSFRSFRGSSSMMNCRYVCFPWEQK